MMGPMQPRLSPPRRLLVPALVAAACVALVAEGVVPHVGPARVHTVHRAAAVAHVDRPPAPPPAPPAPPQPILTIASLRAFHPSGSGPILPIGPARHEQGYSVQRIAYHSQGLRVTGTLLIPSGKGRHPLVISLHGFSTPRSYADGGDAMPLAIPLAEHGVFVGVPDYRGLGGSAPDPRTEPLPIADAIDSITLLDLLVKDPRVDRNHVGLIAHSLGGNVAEVMLASHSGIRAAVLYAPSESQASVLVQRRPGYYRGRPGVPPPGTDPSLYTAMSPGANFEGLHCEVLLQQGTADPVVPWHASVVAAHELSAAGAAVTLRLIPGATHDLDTEVWTVPLENGTSFLLKNL
jgi:dipeptidyl aminopeptidase/acylaminoacyl peptidase